MPLRRRRSPSSAAVFALQVPLVLALAAGCATTRPAPDAAPGAESASAPAVPDTALAARPNPGEQVEQHDLNKDGRPDVIKYYVVEGTGDAAQVKLLRKESDLNFDGRTDVWVSYAADGSIERQALDLDFDAQVDVITYFEKGQVARKEVFTRFGERPDTFKFYERGRLVRIERDRSGDGRIDTWEYWENDQVDRIGQDLTGDGEIDRWTRRTAP